MSTLEKALQIASKAHEGQRDKGGRPYILHPIRVMMSLENEDEETQIVAVLHDVVEDTQVTGEDLKAEGFSEDVLLALLLLTRAQVQSYAAYVITIKTNKIATKVKLADLKDNSRIDRAVPKYNSKGLRNYFLSYKFLTDQLTTEEYQDLMEYRK